MKKTLLIFLVVFIVIQFIQTDKINSETNPNLEMKTPSEIKTIFKSACYDCHSNSTNWPWYSHIAPFSWIIDSHVTNGRKALNFSIWETYSDEKKEEKMKAIFRTAYASMPLASYIKAHEDANLTREQRTLIRDWTGVKK
ncbi:cytochrome C [Arcobacter sp. CECT 8983]|uniref:heme-binding domain-containing protein n=1 Tax=Arcobacter sp. CECT 8983 TaxID=2044508 RepID=UPI00100BF5E9|nr:heme-binding domain-containing protein [Arcobacter sp. CECT 8983]RXJ90294.1 cytochrome C [Arcobacter sp. CECT 8983]